MNTQIQNWDLHEFTNHESLITSEHKYLIKLSNNPWLAESFIKQKNLKESLDFEIWWYLSRFNINNSNHDIYKLYCSICQKWWTKALSIDELKEKYTNKDKHQKKTKDTFDTQWLEERNTDPWNKWPIPRKPIDTQKTKTDLWKPKEQTTTTKTPQDSKTIPQPKQSQQIDKTKEEYSDINYDSAKQTIEKYYTNDSSATLIWNDKDKWRELWYIPDWIFWPTELKQLQDFELKLRKDIKWKTQKPETNPSQTKTEQKTPFSFDALKIQPIANPQELFDDNWNWEKKLWELSFDEIKNLAYAVFGSWPWTDLMIKLSQWQPIFIARIIALARHESWLEYWIENNDPTHRRTKQKNKWLFQISWRNITKKYQEMLERWKELCKNNWINANIWIDPNNSNHFNAQEDLVAWLWYVQARNEIEWKDYFSQLRDPNIDTKKLMPNIQKWIKAIWRWVDRQLETTWIDLKSIPDYSKLAETWWKWSEKSTKTVESLWNKNNLIWENTVIFWDSWVQWWKETNKWWNNAFWYPWKSSSYIANRFLEYTNTQWNNLSWKTLIIQAWINNAKNTDVLTHIDRMVSLAGEKWMNVIIWNYCTDHPMANIINKKLIERYQSDWKVKFVDLYTKVPWDTKDLHPYHKYPEIIATLQKANQESTLVADASSLKK